MIVNKVPVFVFHRHKSTDNKGTKNNSTKINRTGIHLHARLAVAILLFLFMITEAVAGPEPVKNYLRIEKNKSTDTDDLEIKSIGVLGFKNNSVGHVDLISLQSEKNGDGLALEFGGGYVFNWYISLFMGLGISLGYNSDIDDAITAYYPEAGIVVDITNKFGLTVSAKRYHRLYDENEVIVMMGLLFRN
jgi:hypothetical protein